jgi:hypothetical protein
MSSVQIEQKNYEVPPRDGFTVTHFISIRDLNVPRRTLAVALLRMRPPKTFS